MKLRAAVLFAVYVSKAAGGVVSPLANELAFVEHAIDRQLHEDHAPDLIRQQEAALLSQADKAIQGTQAKMPKKQGSSFLANHNQGHSSARTAQALAAKVSQELQFVTKAAEVQLTQDHAPAALVQQEEGLLKQALAAAQKGQQMVGKTIAAEAKERSIEQKLRVQISSAKASVTSSSGALQQFAKAELTMVSEANSRLDQTEYVTSEAMKALKDVHANATMQQKVAALMAKVELEEHHEIASAKNSAEVTRQLEEELAKHKRESNSMQASIKKLQVKSFQHMDKEHEGMQQKLEILENKNVKLHVENKQLEHEHAVLQHEEQLEEDNTALTKANKNLRVENAKMKLRLASVA